MTTQHATPSRSQNKASHTTDPPGKGTADKQPLHTEIQTPLARLYHFEAVTPDEVYLVQPMGGGQIEEFNWRRTADEVRRMAAHLKSLDLPLGSRIGILSKNCAYWIMADLAIWMSGHVSVPVYPTLSADSVRQILEHSETSLLFVGKLDGWENIREGIPANLPVITFPLSPATSYLSWQEIISNTAPLTGNLDRRHEELATIIYTSGSTGVPKGVMTSFDAMVFSGYSAGADLKVTPEDRMLSYLPMSHVFERYIVEQCSLQFGFQLYFAESLDTFLEDLKRARPTLFISVPRLWNKFQAGVLAKLPQRKLDILLKVPLLSRLIKKKVLSGLGLEQVRIAGSGSAPLSAAVIDWYRALGLELLEGYGLTENFAYSHLSRPGRVRVGYVGEPLPGVEHRISSIGEVEIKSPGNMMGYYKAPDLTAAAFTADGFLKTGDKGEIDELGRLRITGRIKDIFKTNKGKYVAPAPIENLIVAHPEIELVCVSGADQVQAHALVMLSEGAQEHRDDAVFRKHFEAEMQTLLEKINQRLDPHERLSFMVVVGEGWSIENGCLTPTMKMKRDAIEMRYHQYWKGWYERGHKVIWE